MSAATVPLASPAEAASARPLASGYRDCPQKFACKWWDRNFTGRRGPGENGNWFPDVADEQASSVFNNGRTCDVWLWTEHHDTGDYLYLYKGSRLAYLNENSGPGPVGSWEDIIQSAHWCTPAP